MAFDVVDREDVRTSDGRVFWHLADIPYTRKSDGVESALVVWHSKCVQCGAAFTVTTPPAGKTNSFYQKHCKEHAGGRYGN